MLMGWWNTSSSQLLNSFQTLPQNPVQHAKPQPHEPQDGNTAGREHFHANLVPDGGKNCGNRGWFDVKMDTNQAAVPTEPWNGSENYNLTMSAKSQDSET